MHRRCRPKVHEHLFDRSPLRIRWIESQASQKAINQFTIRVVGHADRRSLELSFSPHQCDLNTKELVVNESTPGVADLFERVRRMDVAERRCSIDQAVALQKLGRNRVAQPALAASAKCLPDCRRDLGGADPSLLAIRVDRHDPSGLITNQIDDRVRHLAGAAEVLALAEYDSSHPSPELLRAPGLVEECEAHLAGVIFYIDEHHGPFVVLAAATSHTRNLDHNHALIVRHQLGDGRRVSSVDIASRVRGENVVQSVDIECSEASFAFGPDTSQLAQRHAV